MADTMFCTVHHCCQVQYCTMHVLLCTIVQFLDDVVSRGCLEVSRLISHSLSFSKFLEEVIRLRFLGWDPPGLLGSRLEDREVSL